MSRGPGKIERAIERVIRRDRRGGMWCAVTATDIEREIYDAWFDLETIDEIPVRERRARHHRQRVAVIRAMHSFVRKHKIYRLAGGQGRAPLVIVRADEVEGRKTLPAWCVNVRRA
jgi:hypothetical protein